MDTIMLQFIYENASELIKVVSGITMGFLTIMLFLIVLVNSTSYQKNSY